MLTIYKYEVLAPGYDDECTLYSADQIGCEVIGNIHETPELLGDSNDAL